MIGPRPLLRRRSSSLPPSRDLSYTSDRPETPRPIRTSPTGLSLEHLNPYHVCQSHRHTSSCPCHSDKQSFQLKRQLSGNRDLRRTFTDESNDYVEPEEVGEIRARELFQYYRPPAEAKDETVFLPYPDTVLQAHAQLATYRLDVQRAMIGLVGKDCTYFVAEATRTLDLGDTSQSEHANDGLWYGSISAPKKGGLVEWTLAQDPRIVDGQEVPAHYEVLDMSKNPRWMNNSFVNSEPYFRYYCGVPLRTENDINIGALFLLDDRPRDSTSLVRLRVLLTLAQNIMAHMRTVKEAHEKQRAISLNMCMADFICPDYRFRSRQQNPRQGSDSPQRGTSKYQRAQLQREARGEESTPHVTPECTPTISPAVTPLTDGNHPEDFGQPVEEAAIKPGENRYPPDDPLQRAVDFSTPFDPMKQGSSTLSPNTSSKLSPGSQRGRSPSGQSTKGSTASSRSPLPRNITEADHQRVFDRATYLIRQSMCFSQFGGGGVVLLDTNANANSADPVLRRHEDDYEELGETLNVDRSETTADHRISADLPGPRSRQHSAHGGAMRERVVLAAASVTDGCTLKNFGRADPSWRVTLTPSELQRMCKRHPRGKLYDLPDHIGTSLFDWEGHPVTSRLSSKLYELVLLRRQFPHAKQVIFVPMFHANLNRWSSCLAWTNSRYRVFSYDMDYLPLLSFCNAIRAEIVRLATVFADQQKSDFIGSVSHELRSPLHGILASLEFLQDTDCDPFQKSCLDTLDACAHTLLDTVAMVLDYSKVNTLKHKASNRSTKSSRDSSEMNEQKTPAGASFRNEPLFAVEQECNVALVAEEVVDGLSIGHLAKTRMNVGFDDAAIDFNPTLNDACVRPELRRIVNATRPEVELILDITPTTDWVFSTQPGAIRRLVMNLFGNSLKYTKHGYIKVCLRSIPPTSSPEKTVQFAEDTSAIIKLTVTDTGQGISPEYLRTKIFTPFSQENARSAGTGLGLSIVRSIVNLLSGEIDIKSIVNVGTMVTITLPMRKPNVQQVKRLNTPGAPSKTTLLADESRVADQSVMLLQNLKTPPQAAIYEPALELDSFGQTQGATAVHSALVQYLTGWFGFPVLQTWDFDLPAQILIVDEIHLPTLLAQRPDFLDNLSLQSIIILCANPGRQAILAKDIQSSQVELLCKPFGPYKLARVVKRALEKTSEKIGASKLGDATSGLRGKASPTHSTTSGTTRGSGRSPRLDPPSSHGPGYLGVTHVKEVSASSDGGFPFPKHAELAELDPKARTGDPAASIAPPAFLAPPGSSENGVKAAATQDRPSLSPDHSVPDTNVKSTSVWENSDTVQSRKPRLLLVDDNKINLKLLQSFVQKRGYDDSICKTAEDGQQAVESYDLNTPDVIFMDISMPVMNGFEATRIIRRRESEKRKQEAQGKSARNDHGPLHTKSALVVALTGNAKGSDQSEAFEAGVDIYMTKPVSLKQVGRLLENWRDGE
ncbi:hypothetical protein AC578_2442 [Pseudocercospora eumusae]|uniref:Histidine kinase n=1 Tax=Pseudocercospora eumusae TaxID=321146 RepID=A0A139HXD5_9PEZI|nr:hypothetical protein AC578_2442 [Pseudocercospora eumusae]